MANSMTVSWEVWADGEKRYQTFVKNNKTEPNYVTIEGHLVQLKNWKDSQNRVIKFKKDNNNKNPLTVKLTIPVTDGVVLINNDVLQSSTSIKSYVEKNGQLPNYVIITGKKYNMEQYMYISSKFITTEGLGSLKWAYTTDFKKHNISKPKIIPIKADIDKQTFHDMGRRVTDYMDKNGKAPLYVSSKYGDVQFQAYVYSNSKILDYCKKNNVMPNYVSLNLSKTSKLLNYMPQY